jgi:hypothetical protein
MFLYQPGLFDPFIPFIMMVVLYTWAEKPLTGFLAKMLLSVCIQLLFILFIIKQLDNIPMDRFKNYGQNFTSQK